MSKKNHNLPRLRAHRAAMKLIGSRSKIDKLITRSFREYDKKEDALERWKQYVLKKIDSLKAQVNTKQKGDVTIESLVLVSSDGKFKLHLTVSVRHQIDSRGDLALNLIREFLDEKLKTKESKISNDDRLIIEFLQDIFVQRRRKLVVTDGLLKFTRMKASSISDPRLKKAHALLQEAISTDRSQPYVKLFTKENKAWIPYRGPVAKPKKRAEAA